MDLDISDRCLLNTNQLLEQRYSGLYHVARGLLPYFKNIVFTVENRINPYFTIVKFRNHILNNIKHMTGLDIPKSILHHNNLFFLNSTEVMLNKFI